MNERIRELAAQAGYQPLPGFDFANDLQEVFLKKFAEMIVRECIKKCEFVAEMATLTNDGEMARKCQATANSCAKEIKRYFEIKE